MDRSSLLGTLDDPHVKPLGKTCVVSAGRVYLRLLLPSRRLPTFTKQPAKSYAQSDGREREIRCRPRPSVRPSVRGASLDEKCNEQR